MSYVFTKIGTICMVVIFLLSLFPGTLTEAHSSIVKTLPEGGQRLNDSPDTIEIWFVDPVKLHSDTIKLIGTSGKSFNLDSTYIDPKNPRHIVGNIKKELPADSYTAEINVIALDGDILTQKFSFEVLNAAPKKNEGPLKLLKQSPNDGEIISGEYKKIDLWFNQSVDLTAIGLFDKNQQPIKIKEPYKDPQDPTHIIVEFDEPLDKGTFQVTWYARPSQVDSSNKIPDILDVFYFANDEFTPIKDTRAVKPMSEPWFSQIGFKQFGYWLIFVGITLLFGSSFFNKVVSKDITEYKRWRVISLGLILITTLGAVLLIIQQRIELMDLPLNEFFSLKYIWVPIVQIILLLVGYTIKKVELVAFGLALVTVPFVMGHASYPRYGGFLSIIVNALHLTAASIWLGGIFSILTIAKKNEFSLLLERVSDKFSRWALWSLLVIILTGFIMTFQYVPSFSIESFLKSEWGKAIILKVAFTTLIIIIGYLQRKALKQVANNLFNKFYRRSMYEFVYGLLLIFFASILVVATPTEAEQGVYPQNRAQYSDIKVDISPLKPGLNVLTLDFNKELDIKSVKVKIAMPPDYSIEYNAFKVNKETFKITGNIIHSSGTLSMEVEAVKANGELRKYEYTIVVPGTGSMDE
ncbi:copper resistance protein CopC [Bacillus sp. B1-b2]|uniref:copper resistance protein CopC n=1 Tax=Bacillus sp. B1-b2 TaxID=2653201 RepID=UPI0012629869|nr:copper resistance protein CopC [Bacillus sp. B1-b2]KAB7664157.1 hypothetical protein F9279_23160 [Bacillus sp. B1-b2]